MVRLWQTTGADIVEAVKIKRGQESLSGKLGALLFYVILNKLAGVNLKGASDFKLMNRRAVDAWLQMEERNVFFRGMTAWLGFTRAQIPFEVPGRARRGNRMVLPATLRTGFDRHLRFFFLAAAVRHGGRVILSYLFRCLWYLYAGFAACRQIGQWVCHSYSVTSHYRKLIND